MSEQSPSIRILTHRSRQHMPSSAVSYVVFVLRAAPDKTVPLAFFSRVLTELSDSTHCQHLYRKRTERKTSAHCVSAVAQDTFPGCTLFSPADNHAGRLAKLRLLQ